MAGAKEKGRVCANGALRRLAEKRIPEATLKIGLPVYGIEQSLFTFFVTVLS